MILLKKNKYLLPIFVFNLLVLFSWLRTNSHIHKSDYDGVFIVLLLFSRFVFLPLDALYISRLIYSKNRKTLSIISGIFVLLIFYIFIDPWFMGIAWYPSWLMKYEIIQNLSNQIDGFFYILWFIHIIALDLVIRYFGEKIYLWFDVAK